MVISPLDIAVIAIYLLGITAYGIKAGYAKHASSQQYFLANRSLGWFTVGAAVSPLKVTPAMAGPEVVISPIEPLPVGPP